MSEDKKDRWKPEKLEDTVYRLASQGWHQIGIAAHLGMTKDDFGKMCLEQPELGKAFRNGINEYMEKHGVPKYFEE